MTTRNLLLNLKAEGRNQMVILDNITAAYGGVTPQPTRNAYYEAILDAIGGSKEDLTENGMIRAILDESGIDHTEAHTRNELLELWVGSGGGTPPLPLPPGVPEPLTWVISGGQDVIRLQGDLTTARTTEATYVQDGLVLTAPANTLRHESVNGREMGLIEGESTNLFLNSNAPVTQDVTTASDSYTLSCHGSGSVTASGTGTGTATQGNPVTFVATAGTLTVTVNGSLDYVQVENLSFATSFITTAGTPVTRAADMVSFDFEGNVPFPMGQNEVSIFLKALPLSENIVGDPSVGESRQAIYNENGGNNLFRIFRESVGTSNGKYRNITSYFGNGFMVREPFVDGTIAVTKTSGNTQVLYNNADSVNTTTDTFSEPEVAANAISIGSGGFYGNFFGHISDLMVFDITLTQSQVGQLHTFVQPFPIGVPEPLTMLFENGMDVIRLQGDLTTARSTEATYVQDGQVLTAPANTLRHESVNGGLMALIEGQSTNLFLNSNAPVTQDVTTTADSYTLSCHGSGSVAASGSGVGTATQGNPVTFVATAGTLTVTVSGSLEYVQVEAQTFASSFIVTGDSPVTRGDDYIECDGVNHPLVETGTPLTIFAKVKLNHDVPGRQDQLWRLNGVNNSWFRLSSQNATYYRSDASQGFAVYDIETATYAVTVNDADVLTLYKDGVNEGSNTFEPTTPGQGSTLTIGGLPARTFNGHISDFMIFDQELTAEQIQELHKHVGGRIVKVTHIMEPVIWNDSLNYGVSPLNGDIDAADSLGDDVSYLVADSIEWTFRLVYLGADKPYQYAEVFLDGYTRITLANQIGKNYYENTNKEDVLTFIDWVKENEGVETPMAIIGIK